RRGNVAAALLDTFFCELGANPAGAATAARRPDRTSTPVVTTARRRPSPPGRDPQPPTFERQGYPGIPPPHPVLSSSAAMSYAPLQASSSPPLNRNLSAMFNTPSPQAGGLALNQGLPSVSSVSYNPARKRKQPPGSSVDPSLSAPSTSDSAQAHAQQQQQQQQQQHAPVAPIATVAPGGAGGGAPVAPGGPVPSLASGGPPGGPGSQVASGPPGAAAGAMPGPGPGQQMQPSPHHQQSQQHQQHQQQQQPQPPQPPPAQLPQQPGQPGQQPPTPQPQQQQQQPPTPQQGQTPGTPIMSPPAAKKSRTNTPWSPAEEQRLKSMRDAGNSWSEIAKVYFPDANRRQRQEALDMHYAEFAEDESAALQAAIKDYETNKWKVIGQKVGKPAKACEQYAKEHFGGKT
ncbi:MAG: hypothetical protein M1815_004056, partial [Lichina confinis]